MWYCHTLKRNRAIEKNYDDETDLSQNSEKKSKFGERNLAASENIDY